MQRSVLTCLRWTNLCHYFVPGGIDRCPLAMACKIISKSMNLQWVTFRIKEMSTELCL